MRGRKPKPTGLRVIEGNREHRPLSEKGEPDKLNKSAPRWLPPEAKKVWRKLKPKLVGLGILSEADELSFEVLCVIYSKWREAEQKADISVFETDTGYQAQNAYISIAKGYATQLLRLLTEFGLTPSSRTRIELKTDGGEEDEWEALLKYRQS